MKRLVLAVVVSVFCAMPVVAQNAGIGQFWMPANAKWKHYAGQPNGQASSTTVILYFGTDGTFVRDECSVNRDRTSITISNGDPHNESLGTSEPILDGDQLTYRLVRRTVERNGEPLPGKAVRVTAEFPKQGLSIRGQLFVQIVPTNAQEYAERYRELVRKYADGNKS